MHKRCPQERGEEGQAKEDTCGHGGRGSQAKLDVHIWFKFDKYLISNSNGSYYQLQLNSFNFKSTEGTVFNVKSSLLEVILGTSLEIQNRITTV